MSRGYIKPALLTAPILLPNLQSLVVALKSLTHPDIPFVSSNHHSDKSNHLAEIVDSVSRNIPYTKTLHVDVFHLNDEKMEDLRNYLPRFTGLVFLSFQWVDWTGHNWHPTWANAAGVAQTLGDLCPTLEACLMDRVAWRKMNEIWEPYPAADFWALSGLSRFEDGTPWGN
ncbi:hypothetical protein DFH07DRAFT_990720 [Mycena maculata]|uniref:Uncharacterized protein n=1 Tax=Mycena maculata TaxID=230809 RepID=A0AAD7MUD9_9AGAR|nr:hypothetical protein DFH07DRAFT_990720 [Mycena maculata]